MKFKRLCNNVKSPTKAYDNDAGIDFYSPVDVIIKPLQKIQVKLGIAIEINTDEVAIVSERSGMAINYGLTSIGNIIDAGYRGEISIILFNTNKSDYIKIYSGDKIGQIVICKLGDTSIEEVTKLSSSQRGGKAHFSSGQ